MKPAVRKSSGLFVIDMDTFQGAPCEAPEVLAKVHARLQERDRYGPADGWGTPGKPTPVVKELTQTAARGTLRYPRSIHSRSCRAVVAETGTGKRSPPAMLVFSFDIEGSVLARGGFTIKDFTGRSLSRFHAPPNQHR